MGLSTLQLIVAVSVLAAPVQGAGDVCDDVRAALVASVETAPRGELQPETRQYAGLALLRLGDAERGSRQLNMLGKASALPRMAGASSPAELALAVALAFAQEGDLQNTEGLADGLPRSDRALCLLTVAQAAHNGGKDAVAAEALRKAQELTADQAHGPWPKVLLMAAETERIMGDSTTARETAARASEQIRSGRSFLHGARGLAELGVVYAHLGETDLMRQTFAEALQSANDSPPAWGAFSVMKP